MQITGASSKQLSDSTNIDGGATNMQLAGASSMQISDLTNIDGRISAESVRVGRGRIDAHSVLAFKLLGLVARRSVTVLTSTAVLLVCNLLGLVA